MTKFYPTTFNTFFGAGGANNYGARCSAKSQLLRIELWKKASFGNAVMGIRRAKQTLYISMFVALVFLSGPHFRRWECPCQSTFFIALSQPLVVPVRSDMASWSRPALQRKRNWHWIGGVYFFLTWIVQPKAAKGIFILEDVRFQRKKHLNKRVTFVSFCSGSPSVRTGGRLSEVEEAMFLRQFCFRVHKREGGCRQ